MLTFIGPYQKSLKGSVHTQSATLNFQSPPIQSLNISRGILKLSIICNMVTVSYRCKKPLSVSTVNSQVSLLFSNIIGSKYENGLPCNLFLAETQPRSQGLYHLDRTHSFHGISDDSPENLRKLSVYEKFYLPGNQTKTPEFGAVNTWKSLSILEKI